MEPTAVLGIACTVLSATLGYLAFTRNRTKDDRSDGQQSGIVLTELGYIKGSVDSLTKKVDKQGEKQDARDREFLQRLADVEHTADEAYRRADDAHKKIDQMQMHDTTK